MSIWMAIFALSMVAVVSHADAAMGVVTSNGEPRAVPSDRTHAIVIDDDNTDRAKRLGHALDGRLAGTEQIEIAGRPERIGDPGREQHRALEDELVALRRHAEAIQQALDGIARQQDLEIAAGLLGALEQQRPH